MLKDSTYYSEKFDLSPYTINGLNYFLDRMDFRGKKVLELGGSNLPKELLFDDIKTEQWFCVDIVGSISGAYQKTRFAHHYANSIIASYEEAAELLSREKHVIIDGDATEIPDSYWRKFDIVISFATLEHVLNIPAFLEKAGLCLKSDGVFATQFGPLWNCDVGHHCWVNKDINFHKSEPIGSWGHLLNSPPEMYEKLIASGVSSNDASTAVFQIYFSPRINRVFAEDYRKFFELSPFRSSNFDVTWGREPPKAIAEQLSTRHPVYSDYSTGSFRIISKI